MLYTAKCYWPGLTEDELERAAANATREAGSASRRGTPVAYVGSLLFPDDQLVLFVFESASHTTVRRTTERAGIPCERLMETIWLE
jgi:hypothetical protein